MHTCTAILEVNMNLLGIHLTLLIGPTVPVPAPLMLMEALQSVEVTHTDQRNSVFEITFQMGRSGPQDMLDYPLLSIPLLKPFNRVILIVTFNATPRVLMDGIITNHQLSPSEDPGASTLTITGDDISVMMDMEERPVEHPAQDDHIRDLIEQVLFTSPGERVNRPDFGSGIIQLVFAPNSTELATATQFQV